MVGKWFHKHPENPRKNILLRINCDGHLPWNHFIDFIQENVFIFYVFFLPAGMEKSRTLVAGCSRSGLLDDRLPGMGMMATL